MAKPTKLHPYIVGVSFSTAEKAMLDSICRHFGMSRSQFFRWSMASVCLDPSITADIAKSSGMEESSLVTLANVLLGRHVQRMLPERTKQ